MEASKMELERINILIDSITVTALCTLLVLVLGPNVSVNTGSMDRLIAKRALSVTSGRGSS